MTCSSRAILTGRSTFVLGPVYEALIAIAPVRYADAQAAAGGVPAAFGVEEAPIVLRLQAQGAQIYECKSGAGAQRRWTLREPIAALMRAGSTVGRHYLGPTWELDDGSKVRGKLTTSVASTTAADIPQLKLMVVKNSRQGALAEATMILRVNTRGGVLTGPCDKLGAISTVGYAADYVFVR